MSNWATIEAYGRTLSFRFAKTDRQDALAPQSIIPPAPRFQRFRETARFPASGFIGMLSLFRIRLLWLGIRVHPSIVGYYVYRSTDFGGPFTKVNFAMDTTTTFTDLTPLSGGTYYYVVTSVDATNVESLYSDQVVVVTPVP